MKNILSVIIPSYNRPEELLATLKKLYPQIVSGVTVAVIDNCSDMNCENYCVEADPGLKDYLLKGKVRFIRNNFNIGVAANLMRTFEICESEWMWLLADDDDISLNAISTILGEIELLKNEKDVAFIKFSSRGCTPEKSGCFIKSLNAMIDILAVSKVYFNSFIFTSNGVYRVPYFKEYIKIGYLSLYTYVPHLMMILNYLANHKEGHIIYFSDKNIVTYVVPEMGYSYGFVAGLGVGAFKNFPYDLSKKQYLKLEKVFFPHNDFKVGIDLFYNARFQSNMYVARTLFNHYYIQSKSARNIVQRFAMKVLLFSFYMPNVFDRIIGTLAPISPILDRHIKEIKKRNQRS